MRTATVDDAAACAAIYAPYVRDTAITFETTVPTTVEMATRIAAALAAHEWLVLESPDGVIGYAYAREFKSRAAYGWSVETSVYLAPVQRRGGGGRLLYTELLTRLAGRGYRRAFAGITLPNDASIAFHRALGFTDCGVFRRVGWKLSAWRDVAWLQVDLLPAGQDPPAAPDTARR
ncbi:GNAT family N-acetyltransferase [soil metagenome]